MGAVSVCSEPSREKRRKSPIVGTDWIEPSSTGERWDSTIPQVVSFWFCGAN